MVKNVLVVVLAFTALVALTGCGKSLDQLQRIGHDLIDFIPEVYKDVKENIEEGKRIVSGEKKDAEKKDQK